MLQNIFFFFSPNTDNTLLHLPTQNTNADLLAFRGLRRNTETAYGIHSQFWCLDFSQQSLSICLSASLFSLLLSVCFLFTPWSPLLTLSSNSDYGSVFLFAFALILPTDSSNILSGSQGSFTCSRWKTSLRCSSPRLFKNWLMVISSSAGKGRERCQKDDGYTFKSPPKHRPTCASVFVLSASFLSEPHAPSAVPAAPPTAMSPRGAVRLSMLLAADRQEDGDGEGEMTTPPVAPAVTTLALTWKWESRDLG